MLPVQGHSVSLLVSFMLQDLAVMGSFSGAIIFVDALEAVKAS